VNPSQSSGFQPGAPVKTHFEILDGLRGTAAFCVLLFHILEITTPDVAHNPLRHAHLAVDFFFALSGFVLGHAYDERLSARAAPERRLDLKSFFLRRLIRLHPMVIVAMTFGLLAFLFDPFVGSAPVVGNQVSLGMLALVFGLSLLLLPSPCLPHRFAETHSLDSPAWTLFQEYLANVAYGLFGSRLSRRALAVLCALSAIAVMLTALHFGNLSTGWGWSNFWAAFVRVTYPFFAGLLLYRLDIRVTLRHSYVWLSLLLVALFTAPDLGRFTGIYEALCVIVVFPLTICLGTGVARLSGVIGRLCRFTGRLSYPLYIIHYPAIYVFAHWVWSRHPSTMRLWLVSALLYVGITFAAWCLLRYYDEPLRKYLSRKLAAASDELPSSHLTGRAVL
jgi:peptidoglycan/LPS O-acetylase OafA/YrhL